MDEREFLSTSDPAALLRFLRPRLTERQVHLWCNACWQDWDAQGFARINKDALHSFSTSDRITAWMNVGLGTSPAVMARRCDFLRDIAGPYHMLGWPRDLKEALELTSWKWLTHPAVIDLARGIVRGREVECPDCDGTGEKALGNDGFGAVTLTCAGCDGTGKLPGEPDWEGMPLLADLLLEVGCDNEEIIQHLKGKVRCPNLCFPTNIPTIGGSNFRVYYAQGLGLVKCIRCDDTGWLPGPGHTRGCWAISILAGEDVWKGDDHAQTR